jgi:hypothetical protein
MLDFAESPVQAKLRIVRRNRQNRIANHDALHQIIHDFCSLQLKVGIVELFDSNFILTLKWVSM